MQDRQDTQEGDDDDQRSQVRVLKRALFSAQDEVAPDASGDLEQDTRVHGSHGQYRGHVSRAWEIWGPNGGYMAALAMRAAAEEAEIKRPVSFYCHFLRPASFDWIDAAVSVVQRGRRSESIRVSLTQAGKPVLEGLLRTGSVGVGIGHQLNGPLAAAPEHLPSADDLRRPDHPTFRFWQNIEARVLQPERFEPDRPALPPRWLEWYRFRPNAVYLDPIVDAARVLVMLDTLFWCAAWMQHPTTTLRAPSLDLAAFFHGSPQADEWLLCEHVSPIADEGFVAGSGRVYGRDGRLLGSGAAQCMCIGA